MKRENNVDNSGDYQKGYIDGVSDTLSDTNVHAFFTGVGYGKGQANVTHLGFNSAEERESFERGISKKDEHFNAYKGNRISLIERIFGTRPTRVKPVQRYRRVRPKRRQKGVVKMKSMGFKKEYRHLDRRNRLKGAKNVTGGRYYAKKGGYKKKKVR